MTITTKAGRRLKLSAGRSSAHIFHSDVPRQLTHVSLYVDRAFMGGEAYLNPEDLYDYDKGVKTAVEDAFKNWGDLIGFDKEDRADIWDGVNRMLLAEKCLDGFDAARRYVKQYGAEALNQHIGYDAVKEEGSLDGIDAESATLVYEAGYKKGLATAAKAAKKKAPAKKTPAKKKAPLKKAKKR